MVTLSGIESSIVSLIFSKVTGWVVAAVVTHLILAKARVESAVAKVKAEIKSKFDAAIIDIHDAAEHDEAVVKATIARVEADVRKIF